MEYQMNTSKAQASFKCTRAVDYAMFSTMFIIIMLVVPVVYNGQYTGM